MADGNEACLTAIAEVEKRVRLEFDLHYKSCAKNSLDLSDKLEQMNEIRGAMTDQARRTEEGIGRRVAALELAKAHLDGKFWALSAVVMVFQLILQFWPLVKTIRIP